MADFDTTTFQLILDGEKAAATDALDLGHPDEFIEVTGAAAQYASAAYAGSSPTSITIGVATHVFTLDSARFWKAGTPVRILATGFESNFMDGALDSDEASGIITVTTTSVTGSGTFTSWTILVLSSATTVASPPLGIVDGGTAGTTTITARDGIEVHRWLDTIGRKATPPGGPSPGDTYIVLTGTGAWSGQDDDFAVWNGASWDFETPLKGDSASIDADNGIPGGGTSFIIFDGTAWIVASNAEVADLDHDNNTRAITLAELIHPEKFFYTYNAAAVADNTFTLPNGSGVNGKICSFKVDTRHSFDTILNVAGGETIDVAASLTLTPGDACRVIYSEEDTRWYLLSLYVA